MQESKEVGGIFNPSFINIWNNDLNDLISDGA